MKKAPSPLISLLPIVVLVILLFATIRVFGSDALNGGSQISLLTTTAICILIGMAFYKIPWKDYEIAPMAANVQWVLYHDQNGQVWIKILLNEKEVAIPVATSRFPYYQWEEVHKYFEQRIMMSKKILSNSLNEID